MLEEEVYGANSPIWDPDFTHNPASMPVSPAPADDKPATRGKTAAAAAAAAAAGAEESVTMSPNRRSGKGAAEKKGTILASVFHIHGHFTPGHSNREPLFGL